MKQYPMRLHPAFKDNLWGGTGLKDYHKQTELTPLAESWELSCHRTAVLPLKTARMRESPWQIISANFQMRPESAARNSPRFPFCLS